MRRTWAFRLGDWLLRVSLPADDVGRTIRGDLLEEYDRVGRGFVAELRFCLSAVGLGVTYGIGGRVRSLWRGVAFHDDLGRELTVTLRRLSHRKLQSAVFVLTLAVGIAVNTILFSVVEGILIRPLPFTSGDDLRQVVIEKATGERDPRAPIRDLIDIRGAPGIVASAGWYRWDPAVTGQGIVTDRLSGLAVTDGFFKLFDLEPSIGRLLDASDFADGNADIVVLSHGYWQREMGGDRTVVGRQVQLNGKDKLVLGVGPAWLPADFPGIGRVDFWVPSEYSMASVTSLPPRTRGDLSLGVRFVDGTREADAERLVAGAIRLDESEAADPAIAERSFHAPTLHSLATGDISRTLWYFQIATGGVLLIALANLSGVLVSWLVERRDEIGIRFALGAGTIRVARLFAIECVLLSVFGGAAGLAVAMGAVPFVSRALHSAIPPGFEVTLNPVVLLATFGITTLSAAVLALAPIIALRDRRASLVARGIGQSTEADGTRRARNAFAVGQVALSFAVVVTAVLLLRSYLVLDSEDTGVHGDVFGMQVEALSTTFPSVSSQRAFYLDLVDRISVIPGVEAVGSINGAPLSGTSVCATTVRSEIEPDRFAAGGPCVELRAISPNYFDVVGIAVQRGRPFTTDDRQDSEPVGAISETTARLLWPHDDPIGKRFAYGSSTVWIRVVGVVAAVTQNHPGEDPVYQIYRPDDQWHTNARTLVVRPSTRTGVEIVRQVRDVVRQLEPTAPVDLVGSLEELRNASLVVERMRASIMGSTAAVTALLAMVGLYGVVSSVVVRTRRETAVRLTLGAAPMGLVFGVIANTLRITLLGLAIGGALAVASGAALSPILAGVEYYDTPSLAASAGLFLGLTLIAAGLPAFQIARIDPVTTIRDS